MHAAREVADLAQRRLRLFLRRADESERLLLGAAVLEPVSRAVEVDGEGDEPRLSAVVEVALDRAPVARGGRDGLVALGSGLLGRALELAARRADEAAHQRDVRPHAAADEPGREQCGGDASDDDERPFPRRVELDCPPRGSPRPARPTTRTASTAGPARPTTRSPPRRTRRARAGRAGAGRGPTATAAAREQLERRGATASLPSSGSAGGSSTRACSRSAASRARAARPRARRGASARGSAGRRS